MISGDLTLHLNKHRGLHGLGAPGSHMALVAPVLVRPLICSCTTVVCSIEWPIAFALQKCTMYNIIVSRVYVKQDHETRQGKGCGWVSTYCSSALSNNCSIWRRFCQKYNQCYKDRLCSLVLRPFWFLKTLCFTEIHAVWRYNFTSLSGLQTHRQCIFHCCFLISHLLSRFQ